MILESNKDYKEALIEVPDLYGYKTWSLKKETIIFQTDYREKRVPLGENRPDFPNFFYDNETCSNQYKENILSFKLKKCPFLFEFSVENILKLYDDERLSENDLNFLDIFIKSFGSSGNFEDFYIKPNIFLDSTILKRTIAKIILKLGFDGWIALKEFDVLCFNSCIQHEPCKELIIYNSELMLSSWNNFLDIFK
jgi:hypothetical protein